MLKIQPSVIRDFTHILPFTGRLILPLLKKYDKHIASLDTKTIISLKSDYGKFEIRNVREYIQKNIYFLGYYEVRETMLIKRILQPGDTFIDVGANIGWFTIHAAKHLGLSGKIVSFEPSSEIHDHLQTNIKLNSLATSITKLEKIALSDQNSTAVLSNTVETNSGRTSIINDVNLIETNSTAEIVETIKFDDYYQKENLKKIKLIKIDVEGAEMKVLQGMSSALKQKVFDYILIEVCENFLRQAGSSSIDLLTMLSNYGYSLYTITLFGIKPLKNIQTISFANILAKL